MSKGLIKTSLGTVPLLSRVKHFNRHDIVSTVDKKRVSIHRKPPEGQLNWKLHLLDVKWQYRIFSCVYFSKSKRRSKRDKLRIHSRRFLTRNNFHKKESGKR